MHTGGLSQHNEELLSGLQFSAADRNKAQQFDVRGLGGQHGLLIRCPGHAPVFPAEVAGKELQPPV